MKTPHGRSHAVFQTAKNNKWGAGQEVLIAHVIVAKNKFNNHVTGQRGNSLETSTGRLVNLSAYEGLVFQK